MTSQISYTNDLTDPRSVVVDAGRLVPVAECELRSAAEAALELVRSHS
jgi:hypothetical protein